jgi:uncharacterized protein DUF6879
MINTDGTGLNAARGVRIEQPEYKKDFWERMWSSDGQDCWKLERRQDFREPGSPSWEAFARGDWAEALRVIEQRREALCEHAEKYRRHGIVFRRLRVVESPIIPYLQWELNSFRVRVECGSAIRVVGPKPIRELERDGPLPELVNVGDRTLYEIRYDERGIADGAVRYEDPELVDRFRETCRELYEGGEDLRAFFDREVAHLPPPLAGG